MVPRPARHCSWDCSCGATRTVMRFLSWIGLALIVLWLVLWLAVKVAVGAIHLIALLGLVLVVWGLLGGRNRTV